MRCEAELCASLFCALTGTRFVAGTPQHGHLVCSVPSGNSTVRVHVHVSRVCVSLSISLQFNSHSVSVHESRSSTCLFPGVYPGMDDYLAFTGAVAGFVVQHIRVVTISTVCQTGILSSIEHMSAPRFARVVAAFCGSLPPIFCRKTNVARMTCGVTLCFTPNNVFVAHGDKQPYRIRFGGEACMCAVKGVLSFAQDSSASAVEDSLCRASRIVHLCGTRPLTTSKGTVS